LRLHLSTISVLGSGGRYLSWFSTQLSTVRWLSPYRIRFDIWLLANMSSVSLSGRGGRKVSLQLEQLRYSRELGRAGRCSMLL
jgi:hypothetical protein